jgi:hypothetical protein
VTAYLAHEGVSVVSTSTTTMMSITKLRLGKCRVFGGHGRDGLGEFGVYRPMRCQAFLSNETL